MDNLPKKIIQASFHAPCMADMMFQLSGHTGMYRNKNISYENTHNPI